MKLATTIAIAAAGSIACAAQASTILAYWDFNDTDNLLEVSQGSGTLTTNFESDNVTNFAGSSVNAQPGVPNGQSLALQGGNDLVNNGRWIQFSIDTTSFEDIVLSFATRRTATGFDNNQVSYSVDGGDTWIDFGSPYNPTTNTHPDDWDLMVFDFSGIAGLNDNANAMFRITFDGATGVSGNNRIDNVLFSVIPAPGALALLGLAGLVGTGRRRRA